MSLRHATRRVADAVTALPRSRALLAHDSWSRPRLEAYQRSRLDELVRHAKERSAFYRKLYAHIDTEREVTLESLPPIDKSTMMDNFDELVTDPRLRLTDLETHLTTLTTDELYLGRYRVVATGGSTGRKGVFVFDRGEYRQYLAGLLRANEYYALRPRLPRWRVATIAAARPLHVTYRMSRSLDVGAHRVLRLDATWPVDELVIALNAFRPQYLYSYPSVLALLAAEQEEGRLRIAPSTIVSSGETHTDEIQRAVRAAWDVPWFQVYGTTEVPTLGAHCEHHTGLHLFEDLAIVEVVDEHDRPVPPGEPGHRLLVTNLVARTQPLIRYAITDLVTPAPAPCPCGRPYRVLASVDGRSDDILRLPASGGGQIAVHPLALRSAMAGVADLSQYRILHRHRRLRVWATARPGGSPERLRAAIADGLRARLGGLGAAEIDVDVEMVSRIEDGRDAAGKFRIVESSPS